MADCLDRMHSVWYILGYKPHGMVAVQVPHHSRHTSP